MGKHGNKDNGKQEKPNDGYQPKHGGGQDGYEWAKTYTPPKPTPYDEYTKNPTPVDEDRDKQNG